MKRDGLGEWVMRCRLVARDFKARYGGVRDDLFSAMPPLEAKKCLFRMAMQMGRRSEAGPASFASWTAGQPASMG